MKEVLSTLSANYSSYEKVWIGANDIVKKGTYRWAPDDSPVFVTLPKILGTEKYAGYNCLQLYGSPKAVSVGGCTFDKHIICQK